MSEKTKARGRPKNFYDRSAKNTIQSVDRAFNVLELLAAKGGMTLSEVAAELDQSAATIYRVLSTLQAREVVEADAQSQVWNIGPAAFQIGYAFLRRSSVVERSRPIMRELMAQTGETANLGIEKSGMVMFISQVETHETIRAFFPPGTQSPLHASGIGKALLAHFTPAKMTDFLKAGELERFTENTITDPQKLQHEMETIRAQGFAYDDEEKNFGMRCIAAPVLNFFGEAVAGISVSGPTHRMEQTRIVAISELVKDAAKTLSYNLGAVPDN
jgi:IclR family acetate operon transcriptional repressor